MNPSPDGVAENRASANKNEANEQAPVSQENVAKNLMSKGIHSKKADSIAEAIVASLNGQELTRTQRNLLSSAKDSPSVQDVISDTMEMMRNGIDSTPGKVYDEVNAVGDLENREKAALWDLARQSVDVFGNENYTTATEDSAPHQVQNAFSDDSYEGGGETRKFNNWDDMKDAYKGTITQFVRENKPKYSPNIKKWFDNGGSLEIQDVDGKRIWMYISSAGTSVPYIDGYIKFPDEYLHPTIKPIDIGEFTGDRGKDIENMLSILEEDYGITEIPEGYIAHHDIENGILQLVDEKIHTEFTHIGGFSIYTNSQ